MGIYTGQFSKVEIYAENDLVIASISQYNPPWFNGITIKELAPSKQLLQDYKSGALSFGMFSKEFLNYLETVDFDPILELFDTINSDYSGIVLCCYEPQTQFCHRHLVANFLNTHFQLDIREF